MLPSTSTDAVDRAGVDDFETYAVFGLPANKKIDTAHPSLQIAVKDAQRVLSGLVGCVASSFQLQKVAARLRSSYTNGYTGGRFGGAGFFNGSHFFLRPRSKEGRPGHSVLRITTAVVNCLEKVKGVPLMESELLVLHCDHLPSIAYVQQQALNTMAQGEGLINALFAVFLAAQRINKGLLLKDEISEKYCKCKTEADREIIEHFCQGCLATLRCSNLVRRASPAEELLLCQ